MIEDRIPRNKDKSAEPVGIDDSGNPRQLLTGEALTRNSDYLTAAAEKGVRISDILGRKWSQLEIDTSSGKIILEREDVPVEGVIRAIVLESDDPAVLPGQTIVAEGITMTGGSAMSGVLGPGARLAFRRQVTKHYKLGDVNSDETMTLTPEAIEEYASHNSEHYVKTDDGLDLKYFDPTPRGTDFMSHLLLVEEVDGETRSQYLF